MGYTYPIPVKPTGIEFYDIASKRQMILCTESAIGWKDWLFFKHPGGDWVSLRLATDSDCRKIEQVKHDST